MMQEFYVDNNLRDQMIRTQPKKHPKWKKKKNLAIILSILMVVIPVCTLLIVSSINPGMDGDEVIIISSPVFFITLVPVILYLKLFPRQCLDMVNYKMNEGLFLMEDRLVNGFKCAVGSFNCDYEVNEFKYSEIKKLILNTYHNRITVYGNIKYTAYGNYEAKRIAEEDYFEGENVRRTLYLYYENSQEFVTELSKLSGVKVEIRDYAEELDQV